MRALVQRVAHASVTVHAPGEVPVETGAIGPGLLVLLGVHTTDTPAEADWLARKVAALRVFADDGGRMNRSVVDTGGEVLVVSQFTLYGDATRGNRPSFVEAALPAQAEALYLDFLQRLGHAVGRPPRTGTFGAHMEVSLLNDGPVTLLLDRHAPSAPS